MRLWRTTSKSAGQNKKNRDMKRGCASLCVECMFRSSGHVTKHIMRETGRKCSARNTHCAYVQMALATDPYAMSLFWLMLQLAYCCTHLIYDYIHTMIYIYIYHMLTVLFDSKFYRMRENQKIFAQKHSDTLRACHTAIEGKWDEAAKIFFVAADDPTAKKRKLQVFVQASYAGYHWDLPNESSKMAHLFSECKKEDLSLC
jgi:hypothetical protein